MINKYPYVADEQAHYNLQQLERLSGDVKLLNSNIESLKIIKEDVKELLEVTIENKTAISAILKERKLVSNSINNINERLRKVEKYQTEQIAANIARNSLLAAIVRYGPIVSALLITLVGVGVILKEMPAHTIV